MHWPSSSQSPPPCPHGHAAEQKVEDINVPVEHALGTHTSVVEVMSNAGPRSVPHTKPGMQSALLSQSPPPCPQGQVAEQYVLEPIVALAQLVGTHTSVSGFILKAGPTFASQVNPS
jgi:hypothetical protein